MVLAWPRPVLHRQITRQEPRPGHRERGGAEGGVVIDDVAGRLNDRLPHPVAHQHQVRLLAPDLHILEIPPGLHANHPPPRAVVGRRRHRLPHRRVVAAPVLGHQIGRAHV